MVFDPTYPVNDMNDFEECKCKDIYGDLKEAITSNSSTERGKEVDLSGYVDFEHAGENKTRRS